MTVILFDLVVLAILAGFTIRGGVRGFVLSLCSLLAVVVAFLGAGAAARALSPMAAEFLEPKFAAVIEERLEEALQEQVEQGQQALAPEEVPLEGVLALLREMGFYDSLVDSVDQAVEKGLTHAAASAACSAPEGRQPYCFRSTIPSGLTATPSASRASRWPPGAKKAAAPLRNPWRFTTRWAGTSPQPPRPSTVPTWRGRRGKPQRRATWP